MHYYFFNKIKNLFSILLLIFLLSCNFNPFQTNSIWDDRIYTIPELQNSEDLYDGGTYLIEGYIMELNCSPEDNRFLLYAEKNGSFGQVLIGNILQVIVVENPNTIFNKISEEFNNTDGEWIQVIIKGKAIFWTMVGNGWSEETFLMEIDAIRIVN